MTEYYRQLVREQYPDDSGDSVWEEIPVSYKEFYSRETGFIKEPFFPIQADFAGGYARRSPE